MHKMASWLSPGDVVVDLSRGEVRNVREVPVIGEGGKNSSYFVPEKLEEAWKAMGTNVAMTHGYSGRQLRYSELCQNVRQLAKAFRAEGLCERVQKKSRFLKKLQEDTVAGTRPTYVLVLSNNSVEVYVAIFALWLIECTAILRALYTDDPLSIPAMISFGQSSATATSKQECQDEQNDESRTASRVCQSSAGTAASVLRAIIYSHKGNSSRCSEDPIFVAFTSATSGEPKPVEVSHFRFLAAITTFIDVGLYGKHKHVLVWIPPYQLSGLITVCASLLCGARVVLVPERTAPADPQQIEYICRNHTVNSLIGSPDILSALLKEELKDQFNNISSVLALPDGYIPRRDASILRRIADFFGLNQDQLRVAYGTVETTGPVVISSEVRGGPTRGFPLPHVEVRVLTGDRLNYERVAGPGEEGELVVRGRSITQRYWPRTARQECPGGAASGPSDSEKNFTPDGWFRTGMAALTRFEMNFYLRRPVSKTSTNYLPGDLGFYDEQGRITVLGSMEDLILVPSLFGHGRLSRTMHSSIFEIFLLQQPGVHDVKCSGRVIISNNEQQRPGSIYVYKVISVPRGAGFPPDVAACVVPEEGVDDAQLIAILRSAIEAAPYPLNRVQKVYIFEDLPRSSWKRRPSRKMILAHVVQTTTL
ncbi:luciferin 4-monooxygenase-like [Tropilaelaps mercedesae]|uniref:Luciferin 4-monooxygenase-like n=1 Tax=Tropilaelaps mercedesae TaxID=418985 RepID=A0A1V9X205_9ACAR|nr:luciferin 4-monooxygenase-like [Tropilaelaps mercedesae]